MKLYYATGVCSLAPHIALREAGLEFSLEQVNLSTRKTASGVDLSKLNPKGYVPVLALDNDMRLTETSAILQYIADHAPQAKLLPISGEARYQTLEWLTFISTELHKGFGVFFKKWGDKAWEMAKTNLKNHFDLLNGHLKHNTYLMGDNFTIADAYLYTTLTWSKPAGIDLSAWPALQGYMQNVGSRPSVQQALEAEGLQTVAA